MNLLPDILNKTTIPYAVPHDELNEALRVSKELLETLPPEAIKEMCGGYEKDLDKLIQTIVTETYQCMFGGLHSAKSDIGKFSHSSIHYLDKLGSSVEELLVQESLTYFLMSVMPDFEMNWHHVEWAEAAQTYKYICMLAARDHGKSYFWSNGYAAWRLYRYKKTSKRPDLNKLGREGWLFSFSKTQGSRLLTTLKESIEEVPMLRERLFPGSNDGWAETKIRCKNGTKVIVGSAGESVRGAHPGWIVVDDFLKDNVLYSEEQRKKSIDYFHSVIMNMIQPGGQVAVVGTPFHAQDLYGDLKSKKGWHVREYPSIFPDGTILWGNRYDFATLYEKKSTQGTINFSREHLCRPITSDSSIFPYNILERSLIGSQHYSFVKNIESFPVKLERIGIGVDLAISSNIGADYTVMVVGGVDSEENIWILDMVRLHGATYDQQIGHLKTLNMNFRPSIIQIETNGFQAMFGQMAERENLPVMSAATTAKSKNDLKTGLPGLALLFERGKIKIPHGDQRSKDLKDLIFTEFSSITWTSNGLQATGSHDDIPMAIHQLVKGLDYRNTGFGFEWT